MVRPISIGGLLGAVMCVAACSEGDTATLTEPTSVTPSTQSVRLSGTVYPIGTHVRPFDTTQFGTITLTLESSGGTVGFGLGVYSSGSCHSTVTRKDTAPSQLAIEAEQATSYCAIVFDVTNAQTTYSLRVDHP